MDYEERQALIEEGVNPDDLRMQLRRAAVSYWLRRRAIEAGIRPRWRGSQRAAPHGRHLTEPSDERQ
jgi:hypothetical protein